MELQAQLTALEEEVGMLKGEIKTILQEVRVAILARQNPFLSDDFDRALPALPSLVSVEAPTPAVAVAPATAPPQAAGETGAGASPRVLPLTQAHQDAGDDAGGAIPARMTSKRPVDLAALMVWVQDSAETFSHSEFVMLVTMASYADFFDEGLKQALLDMSEQVVREHSAKASLADFSLALQKLEAIRATSGRRRTAA